MTKNVIILLHRSGEGLLNSKDKDGNTPLQYLNIDTPLSAVSVLEDSKFKVEFGVSLTQ